MTLDQAMQLAQQHFQAGRLTEAETIYRQILAQQPNHAEAHFYLGNTAKALGKLDDAIAAYQRALALAPGSAEIHASLGTALKDTGRLDEAMTCYQRALAIKEDFPDAHNSLGNALRDKGQLDDAIACYQRALVLRPGFPEAHNNLGNAFKDVGRLDEAIAAFRQAIKLKCDYFSAYSNLLFTLHFHPASDPSSIFAEMQEWDRQCARPLKRFVQPHANDREAFRPLRIGYVSADFYEHASAFFLLPLFRHHDRRQFEVTCYAQLAQTSATTQQMQACVPHWRKIVGRSDADVAAMVREDKIDILVDLKLHTGGNRLLVFAHKPAPVQVTWLGYPGTTGLETIDYRLTDPHLDPPGLDDAFYSEQSIRLPSTFWCYDPLTLEPAVNAPPCLESGIVTFGCLGNFCKVNDAVLSLWAGILNAVAGSRLILMAPEGRCRQWALSCLGRDGIGPERVEFAAKQPRLDYLRAYHRIDIVLDTFPYNGHTTSLDSLWMGVPVVTLAGRTAVGRAGASQLNNLGLAELIARNPDQYVRLAAGLAEDRPRLSELRSTLRGRMEKSPLMDAASFTRHVEAAYQAIWRNWCEVR